MAGEWHERDDLLSEETKDMSRAIKSVIEELEAVDWYNQRAGATTDPQLKRILEHNRDEEKEHAAMVLEWIRRRDPKFELNLREYLFTDGEITTIEERLHSVSPAESGAGEDAPSIQAGSLTVGSLKHRE